MGTTLSRLIAGAAIVLAGARLFSLLEASVSTAPWYVVVGLSVVVAAALTWALRSLRLGPGVAVAVHGAALFILVFRLTAPDNLVAGVLPGAGALEELRHEISIAMELIRFGAAPVLAVPGLTIILALLFWGLGVMLASPRPAVAGAAALVFYLQFATLDRRPASMVWTLAFLVLAAATIAAWSSRNSERTGRVRSADGRTLPRRSLTSAAAVSLTAICRRDPRRRDLRRRSA